MYRTIGKLAAVALALGAWAGHAAATDLVTLSSTGASTTVGGITTAQVLLTINQSFNLVVLDGLMAYSRADLEFQTAMPVLGGLTAAQLVAALPVDSSVLNLVDDPLGASLSAFSIAGINLPAGGPMPLSLSFKGLAAGDHAVALDLGIMDDNSVDEIHYGTAFNIHVDAVPEPATYALMLGGLAAVGALARRRRPA